MKKIPSALSLGIRRGNLEIRQFARQRESVVFTLLFPVILLAIFGSVFKDTIAPGVTFSQYFLAGMIASGLVNTGFQALAITIPLERDFGALKRLRGTPMPASSYFIGKAILIFVSMVIQILLLLGFGILFLELSYQLILISGLLSPGWCCWVVRVQQHLESLFPSFLKADAVHLQLSPPLLSSCSSLVVFSSSLLSCHLGCNRLPRYSHSSG